MAEKAQKPKKEKQDKKKAESISRQYTIPLLKDRRNVSRNERCRRAVFCIRRFVERHMKVADVRISENLNKEIWKINIAKPPSKVKVAITVTEGIACVRLHDEPEPKLLEKKMKAPKQEEAPEIEKAEAAPKDEKTAAPESHASRKHETAAKPEAPVPAAV